MVRAKETTSPEESEREPSTEDWMNEVNLRSSENPCPVLISSSMNKKERDAYIELLKEFKDVFAWSYKEMQGLDPSVAVHHLNIRPESPPTPTHTQAATEKIRPGPHRANRSRGPEVVGGRFIREEQHPDLLANVVPVTKKNGQIRICIDFRDLNIAYPKDEFPNPLRS